MTSVLLITPWYGVESNGVGILTETLAQALPRLGHACVVLELLPDGIRARQRIGRSGETIFGICLRDRPRGRSPRSHGAYLLRSFLAHRLLKRIIRENGIAVAHLHYSTGQYETIANALEELGVPWVNTFHGSDVLVNLQNADCLATMRDVVRRARGVSAVSQSLRAAVAEAFPEVADTIQVVHNGVSESLIEASSRLEFNNAESLVPVDERSVLFVGNLIARKGVDILLQSWAELRGSGVSSDAWILHIAGDGVEMPSLVRLAAELGISASVRFLGAASRDRVIELLASASIMVVPSRVEGFGLVAAEGQIFGRAVIASATGGLTEIVQDGTTGLLVPPEHSPALAAALKALVSDQDLRRRLGKAAREHSLREFSPTTMARRYLSLYGIPE